MAASHGSSPIQHSMSADSGIGDRTASYAEGLFPRNPSRTPRPVAPITVRARMSHALRGPPRPDVRLSACRCADTPPPWRSSRRHRPWNFVLTSCSFPAHIMLRIWEAAYLPLIHLLFLLLLILSTIPSSTRFDNSSDCCNRNAACFGNLGQRDRVAAEHSIIQLVFSRGQTVRGTRIFGYFLIFFLWKSDIIFMMSPFTTYSGSGRPISLHSSLIIQSNIPNPNDMAADAKDVKVIITVLRYISQRVSISIADLILWKRI